MEDDDIRQLLHATYRAEGAAPVMYPGALEHQARGPRSRLVTSLLALVAALVVAVPVGVGVLLRSGAGVGSGGPATSIQDLHMYDANNGWAWPGGDEILHTTSGVQNWTITRAPIAGRLIVGVAWVNAESARILTTTPAAYDQLEKFYTLTPWLTDDGGATWSVGQPFRVLLETGADPSSGTVYPNFAFVDPVHGWFFDSQGLGVGAPTFIYRTVDGGLHWSQVEMTPATGKAARDALPVGCAAYGMSFVNPTTGWVTGSCGIATLFDVTHDGGVTWAPQPFPCINCALYAPQFTSPLVGSLFAGTGTGGLFVTNDGGRTWSARSSPPGNWPDFVDANHGFTMGLTGNNNPSTVLWTTTDGGMTWGQAPNGAIHGNGPFETSQLDFISPRIGWVVSVDIVVGGIVGPGQSPYPTVPPALWQTTDAGSTWTLITPTFTTSG
jgi:photosystem II stability/assembly factor-like uncharacterized protein